MRWNWRERGWRRGRNGCGQMLLSGCENGAEVVVVRTDSLQAMEVGLYAGVAVRVLQNHAGDEAMAVEAGQGQTRLSLSRQVAEQVTVASIDARAHRAPRPERGLLRAIRSYLAEHGVADTRAIALHLDLEEAAADGMLAFLEARGQVERHKLGCGGGCGGCRGCGDATPASSPPADLWSLADEPA